MDIYNMIEDCTQPLEELPILLSEALEIYGLDSLELSEEHKYRLVYGNRFLAAVINTTINTLMYCTENLYEIGKLNPQPKH